MSGIAAQDGPAEPDAIRPPGDAVAMAAISGIPYDALTARPLRGRSLLLRTFRAILPFLVIAAVWQTASLFTKPYLFPGLGSIAKSFWTILTTWDLLSQGLVTWLRLLVAVSASLVIGIPIGLAMGLSGDL